VLLLGLLWTAEAAPERLRRPPTPLPSPAAPFVPKFEALAETRLLMEALNQPNYLSLAQFLKEKPADAETWKFARGQALLIAETGNLLLLRPPRNEGRDTWFKRAMETREAAANLARELGGRDLDRSRGAFTALTSSCNRCHQSFRVAVKVSPMPPERPPEKGTE
jgi:cytochrome c556